MTCKTMMPSSHANVRENLGALGGRAGNPIAPSWNFSDVEFEEKCRYFQAVETSCHIADCQKIIMEASFFYESRL